MPSQLITIHAREHGKTRRVQLRAEETEGRSAKRRGANEYFEEDFPRMREAGEN